MVDVLSCRVVIVCWWNRVNWWSPYYIHTDSPYHSISPPHLGCRSYLQLSEYPGEDFRSHHAAAYQENQVLADCTLFSYRQFGSRRCGVNNCVPGYVQADFSLLEPFRKGNSLLVGGSNGNSIHDLGR